jgi:hypothetical protein
MMKKNFITLTTFFVASACYTSNNPVTPENANSCKPACDRMQKLNCVEGTPIMGPTGKVISCTDFCETMMKDHYVDLNPECLTKIEKCADIESVCYVGHAR